MMILKLVLKRLKRWVFPDQPPIGEVFGSTDAPTFASLHHPGMARSTGRESPIFDAFSSAEKSSTKWTHYFDVYDECLVPLRDWLASTATAPGVLEIGSAHGGSLLMWKSFFGNSSVVRGGGFSTEGIEF
jgi:hypothetical protein